VIIGIALLIFIGIVLSILIGNNERILAFCKRVDQQKTGTEKNYKIVVFLFFLIYLLIGLHIFDDYGISWDEPLSRRRGLINYRYIFEGDTKLVNYESKYHGPVFDILLIFTESGLHLNDSREIYLMRHFVTFLIFYIGVFFFYLLCKERFRDWKIGLLGSIFFILSPKIFAHSFYNPKDIPFLSVFILSIYTLIKYLDKKIWLRALLHSLSCGILMGLRNIGILVPCFTFLFVVGELLLGARSTRNIKKTIYTLVLYSILLIVFIILFSPILWKNPLYHFIQAFIKMKRYPWEGAVLYLGNYIMATELPWHYILVWLMITTPLFYVFNFVVGLLTFVKSLLRSPRNFYFDICEKNDLIYLLWFFLPVFMVIVLKSVVYDAWRHLFFVYPAFLIISLKGFVSLFQGIILKFKGQTYKIVKSTLILIILLSLFGPTYFMIKNHPYQNVYFNQLAGRDMQSVKKDFDLDYWGLSYRQAFEYILKYDTRKKIKINVANFSVIYIAQIFPAKDRERLIPVYRIDEADYFASNYRVHKEEYRYQNEFYSIKIGGAKIMVVYKL
jgi:hypothetical protein